jgi:hypothetical protein
MSLSGILALLVIFFALFVILAHLAIEPWWGILALAIAVLLGGVTLPALGRRV